MAPPLLAAQFDLDPGTFPLRDRATQRLDERLDVGEADSPFKLLGGPIPSL